MSESIINIDRSSVLCKTFIKFNEQITFTSKQIENLFKLHVLNMKPQECVTSVSSTLKLDDIEENFTHFWLANTLSSVVRNIQLSRFSVQQGVIIVRWIIHFISLVIVEKLGKVMLFEKLRKDIIVALENAGDFMIPLPNSTEPTTYVTSTKNKVKYTSKVMKDTASDSNKPMAALQMAACIANTLHDMFWDDFKYTVIQMAFNTDQIQKLNNKIPNTLKDIDPLYLQNNSTDLIDENTADQDEQFCAILDRYFLRTPNNPSSVSDRLINSLKQSLCRKRRLYDLYNKDE
ncbi:uncharacterized protein LOC132925180 [Rhopalosiphum padi]|uniref:uncharacterized protein LOC132925180 n=1 Tax=Rhopalosiphum padi TaxID=40932 RepID=UPI00298E6804|nr:uncharacterized protein LOC132925180 [Rhopalosiphum padi]